MKEKKQSLSDTIKDINKKYGVNSLVVADDDERGEVEGIPTTCYSLDKIFGCGGFPRGRIVDISGAPSSGKSTIAMYIVGQIQKSGGVAAWVDAEACWTNEYAKKVGVDTDKLLLNQPVSGEEGLDIVEKLVNTGEVDVIVIDSTAALVPARELEGEIGDSTIALQARLLSKGLRMIVGVAARSKTAIVFISQMRDKIGAFVGPTTDSTGGKALKFYASVRLKVERMKTLKNKADEVIGNHLKITATKNKIGMPFKEAEFDVYFEKGIDVVGDILDVAVSEGIITRAGMTYSYGDKKLGVGRDTAKEFLEVNPDVLKEIRDKFPPLMPKMKE